MPLDEFWHGDTRLLEAYRKQYERKISYEAWVKGQYTMAAFDISMGNAFAKKGTPPMQYPKWDDPIAKQERKLGNTTPKKNIEDNFREQQANMNSWLGSMINK